MKSNIFKRKSGTIFIFQKKTWKSELFSNENHNQIVWKKILKHVLVFKTKSLLFLKGNLGKFPFSKVIEVFIWTRHYVNHWTKIYMDGKLDLWLGHDTRWIAGIWGHKSWVLPLVVGEKEIMAWMDPFIECVCWTMIYPQTIMVSCTVVYVPPGRGFIAL